MISAGGLHRRRDYSTGSAARSPAGIESITSLAITDSAAPTRAAASRPARAWARTAAQAAAKGSRPRASSAAMIPERTSPLPAVASAGAESALTATRSPSVTIVSSPLRTTTAPAARAASRAQASRWAPISSESRPSSRPSSPACGVRTVGACAGRERAEVPGEGVEAVGVDHQRRLDRADDLARQLDRAGVAAQARARARRRRRARRRAAPPSPRPAPGSRRRRGSRPTSPPARPASKTGSRSAGTATVA